MQLRRDYLMMIITLKNQIVRQQMMSKVSKLLQCLLSLLPKPFTVRFKISTQTIANYSIAAKTCLFSLTRDFCIAKCYDNGLNKCTNIHSLFLYKYKTSCKMDKIIRDFNCFCHRIPAPNLTFCFTMLRRKKKKSSQLTSFLCQYFSKWKYQIPNLQKKEYCLPTKNTN